MAEGRTSRQAGAAQGGTSRRRSCPRCGYDLAGIQGRVCPECGADPKKRPPASPWLTLLFALGLPFGLLASATLGAMGVHPVGIGLILVALPPMNVILLPVGIIVHWFVVSRMVARLTAEDRRVAGRIAMAGAAVLDVAVAASAVILSVWMARVLLEGA